MSIPKGTTHIWTPALEQPFVGPIFRRAYYKLAHGMWLCYTINGEWVGSMNTDQWFKEEKQLGYFVTKNKYLFDGFVPVSEDKE